MMIVTPDDQPSKQPSDRKVEEELQTGPEEPPPVYSPQTGLNASEGTCPLPAFKTKPTNFLSLATADSIKGEFVIDPSIRIPSPMLPALRESETEDDRKNLSLTSQYSSVHADIWLLVPSSPREGAKDVAKPRRTTIALIADHGSIQAQLHTFDGTAPFSLTARAAHGTIRLALPRSFQGTLLLSTRHGSVSLSDPLVQHSTQLSQVEDTRRYFVGDFQALGEGEWEGDQVEIQAPHGSLRLKYVDEIAEEQGKKGLFSRLFGM